MYKPLGSTCGTLRGEDILRQRGQKSVGSLVDLESEAQEDLECTQASTDSVAKDVAAPDTTRGPEGTCSPESTDWGADDEVLEEWRPKNTLGRAERTHKSQTSR